MRIRTIKPEFWYSTDVAALSMQARLVFIGMWSYADDDGNSDDSVNGITSALFGHEDDVLHWRTLVAAAVEELVGRGLLVRYQVTGRGYLHIPTFSKHQVINRRSKPRVPGPEQAGAPLALVVSAHDTVNASSTEPSVSTHGVDSEGSSGKGREGKGRELSVTGESADQPRGTEILPKSLQTPFEAFWAAYPKKVGKTEAQRRFKDACKRADHQTIVTAAVRYATSRRGEDAQYTANPATWLHQGRWEDEAASKPRPEFRPGTNFGGGW